MGTDIRYSIIIPVYNEEDVINETYKRLKRTMEDLKEEYELLFVNDGSRDNTAAIIKKFRSQNQKVKLINFSRNFGHQVAITAGMDYATGDAVVIIDADLQDPPELIAKMVEKWKEGYDVVYAKRTKRKGETFLKKKTAHIFYRLLRASIDIDIPVDTGDFRLLDRKVCEELKRIPEKNRFMRGLVSWIGFKQIAVEYERDERQAGETKYPLKKMIKLSLDAMTSFSQKPIKAAGYVGAMLMAVSLVYFIILLIMKNFTITSIGGWNIVIVMQLLLSGIILVMLGIMGEYIGRIYDEAKNRPLYIISECCGLEKDGEGSERKCQLRTRII